MTELGFAEERPVDFKMLINYRRDADNGKAQSLSPLYSIPPSHESLKSS
jgi:hypothetical protein